MPRHTKRAFAILIVLFALFLRAEEGARFTLTLSKEKAWLGEPIFATFTLRYGRDLKVDRAHFEPKGLEPFELLELNATGPKEEEGKIVRVFRYLLTPTEPGSLKIPPQTVELAYQDRENYRYITHRFQSPAKELTVREVPGGLKAVGDYRMALTSDANRTLANRPVHLELRITGIGDAEYIPAFELKIPGASVYPSQPKVRTRWLGGQSYRKEFVQRFTVLAEESYTVPPLRLRYFNLQTEMPEVLETRPLPIEVDNPAKRKEALLRLGFFTAGLLLGALFFWLWIRFGKRRGKETGLLRKIRKARSDEELYRLLLPYSDLAELGPQLRILENRLYGNGQPAGASGASDYRDR